jgi:hypothetical protein
MTLIQLANVAFLLLGVFATVIVARQPSDWRVDWRHRLPWFNYSRNHLLVVGAAWIVGGLIGIVRSFGLAL